MTFGGRLKALRIKHNLTQLELAKKINLSKANVSKYEADLVEPNLDTLAMISVLFDVSINYLLGVPDKAAPVEPPISEKQETVLKLAKQLSDEDMRKLIDYAELLKKANEYSNDLARPQRIAEKEQLPAALQSLPPFEDVYAEQENKVVRTDILGDDGYERHAAFGGGVWKEKKKD